MARRIVLALALIAGAWLVVGGSSTVDAQPAPATATQIKLYMPWEPSFTPKLRPTISVRGETTFEGNPMASSASCQSGAITTQRPDAWRCVTADPCFAPSVNGGSQVACASNPWSNEVQILNLTRPITRETSQCFSAAGGCTDGRVKMDFTTAPWALELTNGIRCVKATGTLSGFADITFLWYCQMADGQNAGSAGSFPGADANLDRSAPLWTVFYVGETSYVVEEVGVLVAWY